jgi:hypothetical protein
MAFTKEFRIKLEAERQINDAGELIGEFMAFLKVYGIEAYSARLEDENKEVLKYAGFRVSNNLSYISLNTADTVS